ncbi:hypothetical protein QQF64_023996 [Cirrhinus molitorella]|uniref:Uncharacterized protein n=1 Tax=Cirrhinus molitorella TaxID=172907 RepID=A0ABR3NK28_9TELE
MAIITYDSATLIFIGVQCTHPSPFLNLDPCWPSEILRKNKGRDPHRRPRGKRVGVRNRLRARAHRAPLPSILLVNVQSLGNKLDDLRARVKFQRDIRDCNLLCFTETWLNPARLKQEVPAQREVARWMDQLVAALQDALDDADWDMFRRSSDDVNMFVGFIGKLADDTVENTIIRTFPNQKPWVDKTIRDALRSRFAAYNTGLATGNMDDYKAASYSVRRAVKEAKRRYRKKLESQFQQSDSRSLWQGLRTITDYQRPSSRMGNVDASLADELNTFYARFEATANHASGASCTNNMHAVRAGEANTFTISDHDTFSLSFYALIAVLFPFCSASLFVVMDTH